MRQANARTVDRIRGDLFHRLLRGLGVDNGSTTDLVRVGVSCAGTIALGRHRKARVGAFSMELCSGAALLTVGINGLRVVLDAPQRAPGATSGVFGVALMAVFSLLTIAAFLLVSRHRRTVTDSSGIVDAAIVFVAASMIATEFLVYPSGRMGR